MGLGVSAAALAALASQRGASRGARSPPAAALVGAAAIGPNRHHATASRTSATNASVEMDDPVMVSLAAGNGTAAGNASSLLTQPGDATSNASLPLQPTDTTGAAGAAGNASLLLLPGANASSSPTNASLLPPGATDDAGAALLAPSANDSSVLLPPASPGLSDDASAGGGAQYCNESISKLAFSVSEPTAARAWIER